MRKICHGKKKLENIESKKKKNDMEMRKFKI